MSRDTTVIPFRQPDAIDDSLSELAREGARRMLAQVLIAEADAFVAMWEGLEIAGWPRPRRGRGGRRVSTRCCRFFTCAGCRPATSGRRSPLSWQGRAEPLVGRDHAADGGVAGGLRRLAEARPLGAAIRGRMGGRGLPAGPDGSECRMHARADRRDTRGQEGTRRLPDRGARERAELA
jgi:hypothetical protein